MGNYQQHVIFGFIVSLCAGLIGYFIVDVGVLYSSLGVMLGVLGSMLPDLDHDESTPLKEVFNIAAAIIPFIFIVAYILPRGEKTAAFVTVIFGFGYLFIRLVVSNLFKHITSHRGMFHSIPAMLIVGAIIFLLYHESDVKVRWFLTAAGMLGFLSHLVLDEAASVDFSNGTVKGNKFSGTALSFTSKSSLAVVFTYFILFLLLVLIVFQWKGLVF